MRKKKILNIVFIVIMIMMFLPMLQLITHYPERKALSGYFVKPRKPQLTGESVFNGSFQEDMNKYIENNIGYRPDLVRINNTIDYYLYDKINAGNVVMGKENYAFEESYFHATLGRDFIGRDSIAEIVEKTRFVQDYLARRGITFVVVFAPGKATYFPEYIPDSYRPDSVTATNLEVFREEIADKGVTLIDYNRWFTAMKDTATYPLYPQYGIHWSYYGMALCLDSMAHYIEKERNVDMREMQWDEIKLSTKFKSTDYDLGKALNLMWQLPTYELAYPNISFEDKEGKDTPSLLAVCDSYFWNWYGTGLTNRFFQPISFLYYFNQYYSSTFSGHRSLSDINLIPFVEEHDIVMIMATDGNLKRFAYGFVEELYNDINNITETPLPFSWYNNDYVVKPTDDSWKIKKGTPNMKTVLKNTALRLEPNSNYRITYEAKGYKILQMDLYPYTKVPVYVNDQIDKDEFQLFSWDFTTDEDPQKAVLRVYLDYAKFFPEDTYIKNVRLQKF